MQVCLASSYAAVTRAGRIERAEMISCRDLVGCFSAITSRYLGCTAKSGDVGGGTWRTHRDLEASVAGAFKGPTYKPTT